MEDISFVDLYQPEDLNEIISIIKQDLESNFENVDICINDNPPDFTEEPFLLSAKGICGNCRLLDVGGAENINYPELQNTEFQIEDIAKAGEIENGYLLGACAANSTFVGKNAELIPNYNLETNQNATHCTKLDENEENFITFKYDCNKIGPLANLLLSNGEKSTVIQINCSKRIGDNNFIGTIREALTNHFKDTDKVVGMGGVFLINKGTIKAHVMPDFEKDKVMTNDYCWNEWLRFYDMEGPLVCQSTLISSSCDNLGFRLEHTHFFSNSNNNGGHYHYDITPDDVEYQGYFVVCEKAYRIAPSSPPQ